MTKDSNQKKRFELRKQMLEENKKLKEMVGIMSAAPPWIHWWGLFYALELLKIDQSAWTYKKVREEISSRLKSDDALPNQLREFIRSELNRENPFYPDRGKQKSAVIMQRAFEIGCEIEETKKLNSRRSIYKQIIPKIAEERNMTEAAVKKDYEQKFLPIFKEANGKALHSMKWYQAGLDEDDRFREWLLDNP